MRGILAVMVISALVLTSAEADARKRRSKKTGTITIVCSVREAAIFIDGKDVGRTPSDPIDLSAGPHTVKISKAGFLDFKRKIKVKSDKSMRLDVDLLPFAGVINVTANVSRGTVYVDGEEVGALPLVEYEVKLGARTVEVRAPGHEPWSKKLSAAPGGSYALVATLKPIPGAVVADASPARDDPDLELALEPLEPLAPLPGGDPAAGGDDTDAGIDDLALEMPPLVDPGAGDTDPAGTGGVPDEDVDLLALETLPPATPPPAETITAAPTAEKEPPKLAVLPPEVLDTKRVVEPPTPWYLRWYTIAGGAIAVAAAIAIPTTVALASEGGGGNEDGIDGIVTFGDPRNFTPYSGILRLRPLR